MHCKQNKFHLTNISLLILVIFTLSISTIAHSQSSNRLPPETVNVEISDTKSGNTPTIKSPLRNTPAPHNKKQGQTKSKIKSSECQVPTDCKSRVHIMCVGAWSCSRQKCVYRCKNF
ncbi:hypothetical protein MNBD_GAMMA12-3405 [hydrothermal vent metagenome]|uniref:Uncharacterized protein n=1 Tax=hydrothermal vent metagenome TaxID=652676 RepID=A0A3B0YTC7_9ZZZZ